jgi:hypothetical protein
VVVFFFFSFFVFSASKQRGDRGFYGREGLGLSVKNWTRSGLPAHAAHTLRHGLGKPQFWLKTTKHYLNQNKRQKLDWLHPKAKTPQGIFFCFNQYCGNDHPLKLQSFFFGEFSTLGDKRNLEICEIVF